METLTKAVQNAEGCARTIGEMLLEIGRMSPRAARLIEEDLQNPDLSLGKCADAMRDYARKHQSGNCWSCAVFGIDPQNEAVRVVLDFYKIPADWLGGAAARPAAAPVPGTGGKIDLLGLL